MASKSANYTHGHDESVLRAHKWRTVENSAGYLVPHLSKDALVLDIGCGPATITLDLAQNYVPHGKVIGMEYKPELLVQPEADAKATNVTNVEFACGDVHKLQYEDDTFDVVHAHQVLQHIAEPVLALKEMARVVKKGGVVAVRDADFAGFHWYPESEAMTFWSDTYIKVATSNGGVPKAGRRYPRWAREAGLETEKLTFTSTSWCYATKEERQWWGGLWADRTQKSNFKTTSIENGICTQEDLDKISAGWREWAANEDAIMVVPSAELIYQK